MDCIERVGFTSKKGLQTKKFGLLCLKSNPHHSIKFTRVSKYAINHMRASLANMKAKFSTFLDFSKLLLLSSD
jgi:hypothetical protein